MIRGPGGRGNLVQVSAYLPEVDGLRAIAVTAVVLYHAGLGGAGFVGVDVFFVISGYLITSLLLRELEATGRVDLVAFYARRVRRIMPAAVLVVLATLAASSLLLGPQALSAAANSAGAALVFGANMFFQATTGGYWDTGTEQLPLLHLWSLSVEEQFYLVWPVALWLLPRRRAAIVALAVASLVVAEIALRLDPEAAFYQMPARFWELAAGGLIASLPVRRAPSWLAPAGVLVTLAACMVPSPQFPGVGALPAVLGASMVIGAVHGGATNALLASAPVVGLGRISYSLYLWHWPLLALYRATTIGPGELVVRLELCAAALVLAVASYRYVEQPFRRVRWPSRRVVGGGAALSIVLALSTCMWGRASQQAAQEPEVASVLATVTAGDVEPVTRACESPGAGAIGALPRPGCGSADAQVVLWGDSFGRSWQPFAWELAAREHVPVTALYMAGCPALLGYVPTNGPARDEHCAEFNRRAAAMLAGRDTVVLVSRWSKWLKDPAAVAGLSASVAAAAQARRVLLIGVTPDLADRAPRCIEQLSAGCEVSRAEFEAKARPLRALLAKAVAPYPNVEIIDPAGFVCTATVCPAVKDGIGLYQDDSHLTAHATTAFALQWVRASEATPPPRGNRAAR